MKAAVLQENLIKGVNVVSRVVVTGAKLPVLANLKIKAVKNSLVLSATDLELSVVVKVGAKVDKEGEFTVPAKIFGEFLGSLKPGKIKIKQEKEKLVVEAQGNRAGFQGMVASEFPEIETKQERGLFEVGEEIKEAVDQVAFAAAKEETRPVLTGVQLKREGARLRLVATDGYRLSIKQVKASFRETKKKQDREKEYIVPARALAELVQLIKAFELGKGLKIGLVKEENQVVFGFGDVVLVTKLIEGEFPPFGHIVPETRETTVEFDYEEILKSIRMAAIFARESANIVRWEIEENKIKIKANSPQVGENESVIEAEVKGAGGKIAFNSRYLLEMLQAVGLKDGAKEQGVVFEMSGSLNPGIFRIKGDESFMHVVMPVRVQEA